jgi:hypothetical protein
MKKSITLLLFMVLIFLTRGNVIAPRAYISEIQVVSSDNWTIELGFYEWDLMHNIDSIRLVTSAGSSLITSFNLIPGGGYGYFDSLAVIDNYNLASPLEINPQGDLVKLISYLNPSWNNSVDSVAFGNYPGSMLNCILEGESVIFAMYNVESGGTWGFAIDSSPTIGMINDTAGAMGNFSGVVYDLEGEPFYGGQFHLPFITKSIHINADGSFFERVLSHRIFLDTITLRFPPSPFTYETYAIETVDHCLRPDSSFYQDIITTSLVIGVTETEKDDKSMVTIAPNPFVDKIVFYFNQKNTVPSDEISFFIYSLDGREIKRISLLPDQKRFEWAPGGTVPSGTYIYHLEKNNGVLKTGKFVKF